MYNILVWPILAGWIASGYIAYKIVNDSHQDAMLSGMWDYYNAGSIELIQNTVKTNYRSVFL